MPESGLSLINPRIFGQRCHPVSSHGYHGYHVNLGDQVRRGPNYVHSANQKSSVREKHTTPHKNNTVLRRRSRAGRSWSNLVSAID